MTSSRSAASHASSDEHSPPLFLALRALGFVALALMFISILYATWIALANWGDIQV